MSQPDPTPEDVAAMEAFLRVGGMVEETGVVLGVYGPDLDPDVVTRKLRRLPTSSHRRGDRRTPAGRPYDEGAWIVEHRGTAPAGPDDLVPQLLAGLPQDEALWKELGAAYDVQVRVAVHSGGWTRGFELSPSTVSLVEKIGARIVFDLYFDGEERRES